MIFVILGTHELPFTRLLNEVERLKKEGFIEDEIIVQNGNTPFKSGYMELRPFVTFEQMDQLFDEARLIITHAGTGSVITGLKKKKKVIAAPRLEKYGEHNDDHQLQLTESFTEQGHILKWGEGDNLLELIHQSETFEPKPFQSKQEQMFSVIKKFIDQ
ncbi:PssE/Cps14G family polysaccharide biosynthesis glycosyltransferase [Sinobaca sp. H24]|uniref:PssE/Cps14G family polysaccharide biosynthesis glycosyltransferase n=1 Tax=Sinobaca sp. H24 TaxID=2923376 RepID=UPI00207AFC9C|nr:PssE/Cps14G family polysaccharide biosynthesis glycosyltransferase [Sinobaca sp. H24]